MFDTDTDGGTEEGYGVFRDELFESDKESGFEGNIAIDDGVADNDMSARSLCIMATEMDSLSDLTSCDGEPQEIDNKGQ